MVEIDKNKIPNELLEFFEPAECGGCYVCNLVKVFREVKRVLKKEGTLWLNLGDTYSAARWSSGTGQPMNKNRDIHRAGKETEERASGLPDKNLVGIPWRVAFALQADGWYLRQDIIWAKPNPMPESVTDRCTKSHEYIFLMSKSPKYYFDNEAIKEPCTSIDFDPRPFGIERDRMLDYNSKQKILRKRGKQAFSYNTNKPNKPWEPNEVRNHQAIFRSPFRHLPRRPDYSYGQGGMSERRHSL
jgi:DNA modification methylase